MASLPVDFGGQDLLMNDVVVGVSAPMGQSAVGPTSTGPIGGAIASVKYTLRGVNFNSATTDNIISINLPTGTKNYTFDSVYITNSNHTLTTATLGVFSAVSGGGTTIAADQAISVTNGTANTANNTQALTLSPAATIAFNFTTLYIRVGTAEGAAATADVTIVLDFLG